MSYAPLVDQIIREAAASPEGRATVFSSNVLSFIPRGDLCHDLLGMILEMHVAGDPVDDSTLYYRINGQAPPLRDRLLALYHEIEKLPRTCNLPWFIDELRRDRLKLATAEELVDLSVFSQNGGAIEEVRERAQAIASRLQFPEVAPAPPEHLTDLGNARRLRAQHGSDLRYVVPWDRFLVWDGRRWARDDTGEVMRRAKGTVNLIYQEASAARDADTRKALARWALASEAERRLSALITLVQSEQGIPVRPEELDADPLALNVLNGTLDLRTGQLREHRREDLITKLVPVVFDAGATCPLWISFLDRILGGNQGLVRFLKRSVGYALSGEVREQCLFIVYGTGANGKSTLLDVLLTLLADYGTQAAPEALLASRTDAHPTSVADLRGARLVAAIEVDEGRRLAEGLVKQLTGGDRVKARFMRQDYFSFKPAFKIFLACNHKPTIRGTDHAIWRRIKLIPFDVVIPEREQDKELPQKLRAELPGILRWVIEGCLEWQREGLGDPPEVKAATEYYRAEMDTLKDFLEAECVLVLTARVSKACLYGVYRRWAEQNGEQVMTQKALGMRLVERGFADGSNGKQRYWIGIGLTAEPRETDT